MFFKVKSFLLFFQFLFFTIGIDGSHLRCMFGHVGWVMDGGRGSLTVAGMERGGAERVVDFLGFSIFGNNMNPGEQKLHRKGRKGSG